GEGGAGAARRGSQDDRALANDGREDKVTVRRVIRRIDPDLAAFSFRGDGGVHRTSVGRNHDKVEARHISVGVRARQPLDMAFVHKCMKAVREGRSDDPDAARCFGAKEACDLLLRHAAAANHKDALPGKLYKNRVVRHKFRLTPGAVRTLEWREA